MKYEATEGMKDTLKMFGAYLAARGIPKQTVNEIRMQLTYDAITQAKDLQYDRIYASIGLMLHEEFGFGRQRVVRGMKKFDEIAGSVLDPETDWTDVMNRLRDDVGIIVRTGDGDRLVVECLTEEEKADYKYGNKGKEETE